jgi:hypothetical protein
MAGNAVGRTPISVELSNPPPIFIAIAVSLNNSPIAGSRPVKRRRTLARLNEAAGAADATRARWSRLSLGDRLSETGLRSRIRRGNLLSDAPYLECS